MNSMNKQVIEGMEKKNGAAQVGSHCHCYPLSLLPRGHHLLRQSPGKSGHGTHNKLTQSG